MFWKKLKQKPFCNELHFFLLAVLLFLLSLKYKFFYVILCLYLLYILKKIKLFLPVFLLLCLFIIRIVVFHNLDIPIQNTYRCRIESVEDNGYIANYKNYKMKIIDKNRNFKPGDIIEYRLEFLEIEPKSYEGDLDYKEYLYSKGIKYLVKAKEAKYISNTLSLKIIPYYIKKELEKKLSEESYTYVLALVFSDNQLEEEVKQGYSILNISHILVISGVHLLFLFKILSVLFLKIFHIYRPTIPLLILSIYVASIGFPIACMRALLFLILSNLNEKGEIKYTKLDLLSITGLIMLIFRPYQFYNTGFILSFLVSFILLFMKEFIPPTRKLRYTYLSFYIVYFLTLPIVLKFTNSVSIYALFFSPVLSSISTFILLPISYLLVFFPQLDIIFHYIFFIFNEFILRLSQNALCIPVECLSIIKTCIYYVLYFIFLVSLAKKKDGVKSFFVFLFYLVLLIQIHAITPYHRVTFIDVGQGDSALVELSFNKGNMLIDAYNCMDYLKKRGLRKIKYLILTHSDEDHIKEAAEVISYFNVENVILPFSDEGFKDIVGKRVSNQNSFSLGENIVNIMAPIIKYEDTNSNSIVLRLELEGHSFLFTGDMTSKEEKDVLSYYKNNIHSEVLKVSHHGSSTSSSQEFIEAVSPKYSIISVGKNNKYQLPNEEVILRLKEKSMVYETMKYGNISFYIYKNKMWVSTYR